jgi:gingipain R
MKKILFLAFLLAAMFVSAKDGFKVIKSDANSVTIEYTFSGLKQQSVEINGKMYQKLSAEDCVPVLYKGEPQILRSAFSVALPENAIADIEFLNGDFLETQNVDVAPSKGSLTRDVNPQTIPYTFSNTYMLKSFYPSSITSINSYYNLREQNAASISIFPVQVNAAMHTVRIWNKIVFKITYTNNNGSKANFSIPNFTSLEEKQILSDRFINFPSVLSNSKVAYTPTSEFGKILFISHPSFSTNVQPLVNWKNQKGMASTLVTTAQTGTTQTSIKTYIQNFYTANPGLLYVIFVGDHEQIRAYNAGTAGSETKWSDSFYGMLSGNDHYPEVMVGRLSAGTATEVNTIVNRTLEYEKTPAIGSWYGKGIGIGSNEGQGYGDEGEADWLHMRNIGNKLLAGGGYNQFHEFYDSTKGGNDAPGDPTSAMVVNAVNGGASIFLYSGHGSQNSCATSNYDISDINAGTNYGKYPFSVQVACNNGTFNGGTCFSEAFIRATGSGSLGPKGGIASTGSSILMAWAEPMDTQDEIGDILSNQYANNKKYTLGGLFYNAEMHMLDNYPTQTGQEVMETWVFFGDPSCMIRTASPTNITATMDSCVTALATSVNINTSIGVNKYVTITQNNTILGSSAITGSNTNVAISSLNPLQPLLVTITEFNKIPFTASLAICVETNTVTTSVSSNIYDNYILTNPNPIHQDFVLFYDKLTHSSLTLELFDMQGRLVEKSDFNIENKMVGKVVMNVSEFPASLYFVRITSEGKLLKTVKVVKE